MGNSIEEQFYSIGLEYFTSFAPTASSTGGIRGYYRQYRARHLLTGRLQRRVGNWGHGAIDGGVWYTGMSL